MKEERKENVGGVQLVWWNRMEKCCVENWWTRNVVSSDFM